MTNCEKISELISGYVDNELTQQQRQQVSVHIENCETCRQLYEELVAMKSAVSEMTYPDIDRQQLDELMTDPTANQLQTLGWLGFVAGLAGLVIWHLVTLWSDPEVDTLFKVLVTLLEAGGTLIFAGVLRQRLIARKNDRYKDVDL